MSKNYVILFDSTKMYYPVKAAENPYDNSKAYCAGLPQFFGGAVDKGEGKLETLQREVQEESLKIFLPTEVGYRVHQASYESGRGRAVVCGFYCTEKWKQFGSLDKWPSYETWSFYSAKYREMCWIASVSKIAFKNATKRDDIAKVLVTEAATGAPEWAKAMMEKAPTKEFMESLTFDAFETFVEIWISR